jgi:hypothetical protein
VATYLAVDVPMRLWRDRYRKVDEALRKRLPGRGSTVFDAPPLDALAREGCPTCADGRVEAVTLPTA